MPESIHLPHASSTEPLLSSAPCPCWSHLCHHQRMSRIQKARGWGGVAEEMSAGGPWGWKEDVKDSACDTRLRREIWKPGLEGGNRSKGEPGRGGAHTKAGWHKEEGDECGGRRCPGGGADAGGQAGPGGASNARLVAGLFCCGRFVHGAGCVTAPPVQEVREPHQGLGIQDRSFGPSSKGAHVPLGSATAAPFPATLLQLLHLMTAHRSSGSLGSRGASGPPPDMVDPAVFDLCVPELYRRSPAYRQIN